MRPSRSRRRALYAVAAYALVAIATSACGRDGEPQTPEVGAPAPAFAAITTTGDSVTLASLRGRVVLLNVWATWCQPCLEEIPQLIALHDAYAPRGLSVVGVSIDAAGMGGDVSDFATVHGMRYPLWLDPDQRVSVQFLMRGVPETILLDRAGIIRARVIGALRPGDSTLTRSIERSLQESAP